MFMKANITADSEKLERGQTRNPQSGCTISTPDIAPQALPISDSVPLRGMHD
jgi:hypothetical protein